jgi:parallel beta-helix repeat protein
LKKAEDNGGRRNAFVGVRDEKMKVYCKQGTSKYILLALCVVFSICIFISLALTPTASATLYYVNPGESIQAAVDNASDGDTIVVRDGSYTENIVVNKRLTIRSENGSATVQAANTSDHVFNVISDYVNISGFTVKNSTFSAGISLNGVERCNISYNTVLNNNRGITSSSSNFTIITNNIIADNGGAAICLDNGSSYNRIISNTIGSNKCLWKRCHL